MRLRNAVLLRFYETRCNLNWIEGEKMFHLHFACGAAPLNDYPRVSFSFHSNFSRNKMVRFHLLVKCGFGASWSDLVTSLRIKKKNDSNVVICQSICDAIRSLVRGNYLFSTQSACGYDYVHHFCVHHAKQQSPDSYYAKLLEIRCNSRRSQWEAEVMLCAERDEKFRLLVLDSLVTDYDNDMISIRNAERIGWIWMFAFCLFLARITIE